jgi:hypothetical protein
MKKIIIAPAIILMCLFTSCKKDYTCTCIETMNGSTLTMTVKGKTKKKDAENWCKAIEKTSYNSAGTVVSLPWSCNLK